MGASHCHVSAAPVACPALAGGAVLCLYKGDYDDGDDDGSGSSNNNIVIRNKDIFNNENRWSSYSLLLSFS